MLPFCHYRTYIIKSYHIQALPRSVFMHLRHGRACPLIWGLNLETPTHLPGVIGLQLEGGQRGKAGHKAQPFHLYQGDAVEYDAVRQNQSHEGPAHRDQDCQTTVDTKDQGSVLWVKRGQRQCDIMTGLLYYSWLNATHMQNGVTTLLHLQPWIYFRMEKLN